MTNLKLRISRLKISQLQLHNKMLLYEIKTRLKTLLIEKVWGYSTKGASSNINVGVIIHIWTTVKNIFMKALKIIFLQLLCIVNFLCNYLIS